MYQDHYSQHIPVLLEQVLAYLQPQAGDRYLDLTAGYGGHARAILEKTASPDKSVLVDRDASAIAVLKEGFASQGAQIIQSDFLQASRQLLDENRQFDVILADLGVSSPHLNIASRGFAISQDGPLDMRMDQSQQLSASDIVNNYKEAELADIIRHYGEEPKARAIAHNIVLNRPVATTTQLAKIIAKAYPGHSKIHPATRTFQALRIAVNDELRQVEVSVPLWIHLLAPGGRLAVISFHSLEDRLVKRALAEASGTGYDAKLTLLTKHPAVASDEEIAFNPRARSAKLRACVAKIKTRSQDLKKTRKDLKHANSGKK